MNRTLFALILLCQFIVACGPSAEPPAPTQTPSPTPAEDYLWVSLEYSLTMLETSLRLAVSYYDPATHPTPDPWSAYFGGDPNPPHVRFKSTAGELLADVPLKRIWYVNQGATDGPVGAKWEAFVPRLPEFACLELLGPYEMTITEAEITPGLYMC